MKAYLKCLFKILLLLIAYYLLQVAVSAAFAMVGGINATGDIMAAMEDYILANTSFISLVHNVIIVLLVFYGYSRRKLSIKGELCLVKPKGSMAEIAALGACSAVLVSMLLSLLPIPEDTLNAYSTLMQESTAGHPIVQFIATVIAAPVAEEFLFRGVIYTSLKKHTSRYSATLVACAIFGAMHQSPLWMAYAFVLGVVITLIYHGCGSLFAAIVFHITFNLIGSYGVRLLGEAGFWNLPLLIASLAGTVYFARRLINSLKAQASQEE